MTTFLFILLSIKFVKFVSVTTDPKPIVLIIIFRIAPAVIRKKSHSGIFLQAFVPL